MLSRIIIAMFAFLATGNAQTGDSCAMCAMLPAGAQQDMCKTACAGAADPVAQCTAACAMVPVGPLQDACKATCTNRPATTSTPAPRPVFGIDGCTWAGKTPESTCNFHGVCQDGRADRRSRRGQKSDCLAKCDILQLGGRDLCIAGCNNFPDAFKHVPDLFRTAPGPEHTVYSGNKL